MRLNSLAKNLLGVLFLAPALAHAGTLAHLRATATVKGPVIHLGDVAKIDGGAAQASRLAVVELGTSPLPSYSRSLSIDMVRIKMKQAQIDPALLAPDSAASCQMTRAFQKVSSDQIVEAARQYLQDNIEAGDGKLVVEPMASPRELTLPLGKVELAVEPQGASFTGASRQVSVQVKLDGQPSGQVNLSMRVHRYVKVAVAKGPISRGDALGADKLSFVERDKLTLPPDVLVEGQSLDGLEALQSIAAGTVVTGRMAAEPALIHRGDSVTLQAKTGGILVSTPGVAGEDGRVGQWIRVKNPTSNQESRARVVDSKTVEAPL